MDTRELVARRDAALAKGESLVAAAEKEHRSLSAAESLDIDASLAEVAAITAQIKQVESINTLRAQFATGKLPAFDAKKTAGGAKRFKQAPMTEEYYAGFWANLGSPSGMEQNAALYEGSNTAGGYAVPIEVDGTIVPLAPSEFAIRQLATVVPTTNDVKIPIQSTRATAAAKAESTSATDTAHGFTDTTGALVQKTLSSHMAGGITDLSWEIQQDVGLLEKLATPDLINAVQVYEETKFISGSGSGEPEGVTTAADFGIAHSAVDLDHLLDLIGTLKEAYHNNASFLMNRATSIIVRKAQLDANLFDPVWTRQGSQDYLYGYPAFYSSSMPVIGQGNKVIVFGDFKRGFLIGDRGGSGISVKVLDQTKAVYGLIEVLAYRRTDSLVRRSEALKTFIIDSAS